MKKCVLLLIPSLFLASCSPTETTSSDPSSASTTSSVASSKATYKVSFANTDLPDQKISDGDKLLEPSEPTKEGYLFVGWYLDQGCTQEASFPLTISGDTVIYACFYTYSDAFKKARENTIGENVAGYDYSYELNVSLTYAGVGLTGKTVGESKYKANTNDVSFYDEHENSGALFYDGSKYKIKKEKELHSISLDENGVIKSYDIATVDDDYKYDSSSFAKAVFEYDESKLKNIEKTSTVGEYKLNTSFNFSSAVSIVGNYINHPMVESLLGKLPETSVETAMYVSFDKDKLSTYRYTMGIDVTGLKFDLTYSLAFKNIGEAPTIVPKTFGGVSITASEISKTMAEVEDKIDEYKANEHSSYEYKAKTAVGYEGKNDINATVKGFTKRKVNGDEVYFLNDYEIDTDHKNADLYKSTGLGDIHAGRVKLADGEVHDIKKKLLGGYDDIKTISPYDGGDRDNYYLLDVLPLLVSPGFVQKIVDSEKDTTVYSFGGTDLIAKNILGYFNDSLILDPLGVSSTKITAFGDFDLDSVSLDDFECNISLKSGSFASISLDASGIFETCFPGSRDFTSSKEASIKLELSLSANDDGKDYEPASEISKVK